MAGRDARSFAFRPHSPLAPYFAHRWRRSHRASRARRSHTFTPSRCHSPRAHYDAAARALMSISFHGEAVSPPCAMSRRDFAIAILSDDSASTHTLILMLFGKWDFTSVAVRAGEAPHECHALCFCLLVGQPHAHRRQGARRQQSSIHFTHLQKASIRAG